MNIEQLGSKAIKNLLPYGGLKEVQKRLKEKGVNFSYVTIQTFENSLVIEEAVVLLNELADKKKLHMIKRKKLVRKLKKKL